jgi:hypothetical protein
MDTLDPIGHDPTPEDRSQIRGTPELTYEQIERERRHPMKCIYTHVSRDEQIGTRKQFERAFTRQAVDPFTVPKSMSNMIDESGHFRLRMG